MRALDVCSEEEDELDLGGQLARRRSKALFQGGRELGPVLAVPVVAVATAGDQSGHALPAARERDRLPEEVLRDRDVCDVGAESPRRLNRLPNRVRDLRLDADAVTEPFPDDADPGAEQVLGSPLHGVQALDGRRSTGLTGVGRILSSNHLEHARHVEDSPPHWPQWS